MAFTHLKIVSDLKNAVNIALIADPDTSFRNYGFGETELELISAMRKNAVNPVYIQHAAKRYWIAFVEQAELNAAAKEQARKTGAKIITEANALKITSLVLHNESSNNHWTRFFAEGMALANYQFLKYKTRNHHKAHTIREIGITKKSISENETKELQLLTEAVYITRDLVNEPLSYLTAEQLAKEIQTMGKKAGFKVEVFNKKKIESLKMGGLLAVNLGSKNPPTFSILEYKPKNAKNKKPLALVGKGVVFDTGGLSLKPTENSMDKMKNDMAGAAAVAGAFYAIAKARLPVYMIGLIPATENRPGENAYVPGDVIHMHNGITVEVLNTDAEGRMILADALSYARRFNPELVIDLATLTGAAMRAIGTEGMVLMGTASENVKQSIIASGYEVHERMVECPMWEEYEEYIKSDIADIKNVGGPLAGAITAGMFLKHFTDYPWLHLDIAGVAFLDKPDGYRLKNATGVGVRLLFDFVKKHYCNQ
jgi:leucyl aminopeptidase